MLPRNLRSKLFEWRKRRPWRYLFLPLFPLPLLVTWWPTSRKIEAANPGIKRILIVQMGGIGDLLMATPALRSLRRTYRDACIEILIANRGSAEILKGNTAVDVVTFFQQYDGAGVKELFVQQRPWLLDLWRLYRAYPLFVLKVLFKRYDLGVSLGPFPEAGTFANLIFNFGGVQLSTGWVGWHRSTLTYTVEPEVMKEHWAQIYLEVVAPVTKGVLEWPITYEYQVSAIDEQAVTAILLELGRRDDEFLLVLHPGGNLFVNSKRWDPQKFAQVADHLVGRTGARVLITGSKNEVDVASRVAGYMKQPCKVVAGQLNLGQMGALLKHTKLLITNDTGMLHLADAVGTRRIVSIFGPTDARKIAPRNERNLAISSTLSCAPCIDLDAGDPRKRCWRDVKEECLRTLFAEEVIDRVELKWPETKDDKLSLAAWYATP